MESRLSKKVISMLIKNGKKFKIKKLFNNFFFNLNRIVLRHFWRFSEDFSETGASFSSSAFEQKGGSIKGGFFSTKFEKAGRPAKLKFEKNSLVLETGVNSGPAETEYTRALLKKIDNLLISRLFFSNARGRPFFFTEESEKSYLVNRDILRTNLSKIFLIKYYFEKIFYLYYASLLGHFKLSADFSVERGVSQIAQRGLLYKYKDPKVGNYRSRALKHPLFADLNRISDRINVDVASRFISKNKKTVNLGATTAEFIKPQYGVFWEGAGKQLPESMRTSILRLSKKWEDVSQDGDANGHGLSTLKELKKKNLDMRDVVSPPKSAPATSYPPPRRVFAKHARALSFEKPEIWHNGKSIRELRKISERS
jgi:hypothetical protein